MINRQEYTAVGMLNTLLVRIQSDMNILEDSQAIPYKVKYTLNIHLSNVSKKMYVYIETCMRIFKAVLVIIIPQWN